MTPVHRLFARAAGRRSNFRFQTVPSVGPFPAPWSTREGPSWLSGGPQSPTDTDSNNTKSNI